MKSQTKFCQNYSQKDEDFSLATKKTTTEEVVIEAAAIEGTTMEEE